MSRSIVPVMCNDLVADFMGLLRQGCDPLSTGIAALDEALGGGIRDYLVVVGGAPGSGKTDLACTMCASMARRRLVLYVTFELVPRQIIMRLVPACMARIDRMSAMTEAELYNIARNESASARIDGAKKAIEHISENLAFIDQTNVGASSTAPLTMHRLRAYVTQIKKLTGVSPVVCIDYLQQFVDDEDRRTTTTDTLDYLARSLAAMAHAEETPVIALSSIGKDGSYRGSSHIAHAADVCLSLRYEADDACQEVETMQIHVTKNRYGRSGMILSVNYAPAHHSIW